jgi:phosphoglycerate dehydrogenase-like enzyme
MPAADYATELRDRLPDYTVRLAGTPSEERELAERARIITSVDIDPELVERATDMELFAGVAAGYGHLPLDEMATQGAAVTNASGIHAPNIAEQVLSYVLTFTRNLREGLERQNRREWRHYQAEEFKDSTVTVVGLGAIGQAIVQRLNGFEVETIGVRYTPEKGGPTDEVIGFDRDVVHDVLSRTDYLVVAAPLTDATRGLVDADAFETLPQDAYLVNVGRGPIVDSDALVSALQSNAIGGAALDVTDPEPLPQDHPLWRFRNVIITPHNAGHSPAHWDRLADIVAGNVRRLDEGATPGELENLVRAPE